LFDVEKYFCENLIYLNFLKTSSFKLHCFKHHKKGEIVKENSNTHDFDKCSNN